MHIKTPTPPTCKLSPQQQESGHTFIDTILHKLHKPSQAKVPLGKQVSYFTLKNHHSHYIPPHDDLARQILERKRPFHCNSRLHQTIHKKRFCPFGEHLFRKERAKNSHHQCLLERCSRTANPARLAATDPNQHTTSCSRQRRRY